MSDGQRPRLNYTDDVNGYVIGACLTPYEFWQDGRRIERGHFETDAEAEAYCKEHLAEAYKTGIEMRAFGV
jgi:hypothetical protein